MTRDTFQPDQRSGSTGKMLTSEPASGLLIGVVFGFGSGSGFGFGFLVSGFWF